MLDARDFIDLLLCYVFVKAAGGILFYMYSKFEPFPRPYTYSLENKIKSTFLIDILIKLIVIYVALNFVIR